MPPFARLVTAPSPDFQSLLPKRPHPSLAMSDNPENLDDDTDGPWFPQKKLEWRLDVVTLLAVIGESSMEEHSQAITSSAL